MCVCKLEMKLLLSKHLYKYPKILWPKSLIICQREDCSRLLADQEPGRKAKRL